jgi:hypothetical protein
MQQQHVATSHTQLHSSLLLLRMQLITQQQCSIHASSVQQLRQAVLRVLLSTLRLLLLLLS